MAPNITATSVFLSLVSGIIPAVFWLWFWLREDSAHPEPRHYILISFLFGMFSVLPAYFSEQATLGIFGTAASIVFVWPFIEELMKYFAAYFSSLRTKEYDEPIDAIMYMMTSALGFAAMENFLFLVNPNFSMTTFLTANMRFVGATLLHSITSACVGIFIARSFNKSKIIKLNNLILGLLTATALHSLFNDFIIKNKGENILIVFAMLWFCAILLLLYFEKLKKSNIS